MRDGVVLCGMARRRSAVGGMGAGGRSARVFSFAFPAETGDEGVRGRRLVGGWEGCGAAKRRVFGVA